MLAKDLKKWQLFYNTNDYVCLVYAVHSGKAHVVNNNGTFYEIKTNTNFCYSDAVPPLSVESFFKYFPIDKLNSPEDVERFSYIKGHYEWEMKIRRYENSDEVLPGIQQGKIRTVIAYPGRSDTDYMRKVREHQYNYQKEVIKLKRILEQHKDYKLLLLLN